MKALNRVVFGGFLFLGVMFIIAFVYESGGLMAGVLYFGWFLMAYGFLAFLIALIQNMGGRVVTMWSDYYVVNYGLSLLAIAVMGLTKDDISAYILVSLAAIIFTMVVSRRKVSRHRFTPVALVIPIILPVLIPGGSAQTWYWICQFVGIASLALTVTRKCDLTKSA